MAVYCEVCNAPLSVWTKNRICSPRCRQKRSRDKKQAQQRAYEMGFTIDNWSKLLSQEVITPDEANKLLNIVWDRFYELHRQIKVAQGKGDPEQDEEYDD